MATSGAADAKTVDLVERDGLPDEDARGNDVCALTARGMRLVNLAVTRDGAGIEGVMKLRGGMVVASGSLRRRW